MTNFVILYTYHDYTHQIYVPSAKSKKLYQQTTFNISGPAAAHDGAGPARGLQGRGLRRVRVRRLGHRHGLRVYLHRRHIAPQVNNNSKSFLSWLR